MGVGGFLPHEEAQRLHLPLPQRRRGSSRGSLLRGDPGLPEVAPETNSSRYKDSLNNNATLSKILTAAQILTCLARQPLDARESSAHSPGHPRVVSSQGGSYASFHDSS